MGQRELKNQTTPTPNAMRLLLVSLVFGIGFVLLTGNSLPPVVASHFVAGGAANGFMPRGTYLRFVTALLVGLPLLITLVSSVTSFLPTRFINLPNGKYWLAPERQADTLSYLRNQGIRFGVILILFLCFVHWLVVQANTHSPPLLSESLFFIGIVAFLGCLVIWLGGFIAHFCHRPNE